MKLSLFWSAQMSFHFWNNHKFTTSHMTPMTISDFDTCLGPYVSDKKNLALLLDYDGTLSPLVSHPDLAVLPVEAKQILEKLSKRSNIFIAVISGRSVENVKQMVGINGITYAGR